MYNTPDQARTQFSLWAVMAAPLLIGSNVLNMSAYDLQTYTNAEVRRCVCVCVCVCVIVSVCGGGVRHLRAIF